jgi:hypothetical protein
LIGTTLSIVKGLNEANSKLKQHETLLCANRSVLKSDKELADNPFWKDTPDSERLQLKVIGCSDWEGDTVSFGEARKPPDFNWLSALLHPLAFGLAITLAVSLTVYGAR